MLQLSQYGSQYPQMSQELNKSFSCPSRTILFVKFWKMSGNVFLPYHATQKHLKAWKHINFEELGRLSLPLECT